MPLLLSGASVQRDWTMYPAVVDVRTDGIVYAVGDPHGDLVRLVHLLRAAKIVGSGDLEWTAGNGVLVCTGDLIDKGPDSFGVVRYFAALRDAARKAGAQVIVTMGNHEAEFLTNASSDKSAAAVVEFLSTLPFAARVDDWFFSHAGDTHGRSMEELGSALQAAVSEHGFGAAQLAAPDSLLQARLSVTAKSACGKPWPECYGPTSVLQTYARALQVSHLVQGHQPGAIEFAGGIKRARGEMFQLNGLLFLIDTGMSSQIDDSQGAVLRITKGAATAICASGASTVIWQAAKPNASGRAAACR